MASTLQESLRSLIAKGKTQQALDALTEQLRGTDEGDTITLLQSRWKSNQRSFNMGILSNSDFGMETNRINYALLSVIGDLEDNKDKKAVVQQVQEVIYKIEVSGSGNIMNIGGIVNTGNVNSGNTTTTNTVTGGIHIGDKIGGDKVGRDKIDGDKITNSGTSTKTETSPFPLESFGSVQETKKVILFVAANPQGKNDANSGAESQAISNAISRGHLREKYELQVNFATDVNTFLTLLKQCKPTIVHLSMHGGDKKGVLFEDATGNANYVTEAVLASFFKLVNKKSKIVECVVVSACNSSGHAKELVQCVDAAVGMQGVVQVDVALEYTKGFYSSILTGDDYETAHDTAVVLLGQYASNIEYTGKIAIPDIPQFYGTN
jgi:hypothetical protein